ncbi:hypothetical protein X975_15458, partial [Stegodyphus mimosarum]
MGLQKNTRRNNAHNFDFGSAFLRIFVSSLSFHLPFSALQLQYQIVFINPPFITFNHLT